MIDLSRLEHHHYMVLGYGVSGRAAAMALKKAHHNVCMYDDNEEKRHIARDDHVDFQENLEGIHCLVVSPGIIFHGERAHPLIKLARAKKIDITNDVGLFRRAKPEVKIIGITGTNGKSTTTALIGHILQINDINVAVGGNIGVPTLALDNDAQWYVLELSSYQLESMDYMRPDVAILMNITPDHLDHHGSMEAYRAAKERIFVGARHEILGEELEYKSGIYHGFGLNQFDRLRGEHNWQNMACAFEACRQLGLEDKDIWNTIASFEGLPHRQFKVRSIGKVSYINDSKATNIDATLTAIRSFKNIHLIAGGLPKDNGLNGLEAFKSRINQLYLIGAAQDIFAPFCETHGIIYNKCDALDKALGLAHKNAQNDNQDAAVLLSPAAASFDQYANFGARGDHFTTLVNAL